MSQVFPRSTLTKKTKKLSVQEKAECFPKGATIERFYNCLYFHLGLLIGLDFWVLSHRHANTHTLKAYSSGCQLQMLGGNAVFNCPLRVMATVKRCLFL